MPNDYFDIVIVGANYAYDTDNHSDERWVVRFDQRERLGMYVDGQIIPLIEELIDKSGGSMDVVELAVFVYWNECVDADLTRRARERISTHFEPMDRWRKCRNSNVRGSLFEIPVVIE